VFRKINEPIIYQVGIIVGDSIINKKFILTRTIPFAVIGLVAFILYLLFFVDVNAIVNTLGQTNLLICLLAIVATVLEMVFFALTWQFFLKPLAAEVPFKRIFAYTWLSNFVDLIIPAESVTGEISRVVCVMKDGVKTGKAAASVVSHRILGLIIVAGTLVIGAFLMLQMQIPLPQLVQSLTYLIISVTTLVLFLAMLIFTKERWAYSVAGKIIGCAGWISRGRLKTNELKSKAKRAVEVFYESLRTFRSNPIGFVPPLFFAIVSWGFAILVYYLVFAALGYNIDLVIVIVGYSIMVGIKAIPLGIPAEIGITEIAMTAIFGALGVPLGVGAAAVVLIRIITVWFRLAIGFITFQFVGIKTIVELEKMFFKKK
jgi:uncharacterized protein (TIRG00374 family)